MSVLERRIYVYVLKFQKNLSNILILIGILLFSSYFYEDFPACISVYNVNPVPVETKKGIRNPGMETVDSCELLGGPGNGSLVFYKNCQYSQLLRHFFNPTQTFKLFCVLLYSVFFVKNLLKIFPNLSIQSLVSVQSIININY